MFFVVLLNSTISDKVATVKEQVRVREKILRVLKVYPIISPAMLHIGIGTSVKTSLWRPILDELIDENLVTETRTYLEKGGKSKQYVRISLVRPRRG